MKGKEIRIKQRERKNGNKSQKEARLRYIRKKKRIKQRERKNGNNKSQKEACLRKRKKKKKHSGKK